MVVSRIVTVGGCPHQKIPNSLTHKRKQTSSSHEVALMADTQQQNESSPLLPRKGEQMPLANASAFHRKAHAVPGEPQKSFLGESQTIRHRKKSRSQLIRPVPQAEDDGRTDGDDGTDQDNDYSADTDEYGDYRDDDDDNDDDPHSDFDDNANAKRANKKFHSEKPALQQYGSDSAAVLPLGLAKRKPRWSGLRSKLASVRARTA